MKILIAMALAFTLYFFLFGSVTYKEKEIKETIPRFFTSLLGGTMLALLIGLPIYGIIYLLK